MDAAVLLVVLKCPKNTREIGQIDHRFLPDAISVQIADGFLYDLQVAHHVAGWKRCNVRYLCSTYHYSMSPNINVVINISYKRLRSLYFGTDWFIRFLLGWICTTAVRVLHSSSTAVVHIIQIMHNAQHIPYTTTKGRL